jgi:ABC-type transport system involved in multi-copper enzyme maturation permease subunit
MGRKVLAIAQLTLKAALNEKLLHFAAVFAVGLMLLAIALGDLGPLSNGKILADFGLGTMQAATVLVAIAFASSDLPRELERRTLYIVLSKPVGRTTLLVGKFLGLSAALWLFLAVMAVVFFLSLGLAHLSGSPAFLGAIAVMGLEACLMASLVMLFSLLTSQTAAALYGLMFFVIGHQTGLIRSFGRTAGGNSAIVSETLYRVLPNLEAFNWKNDIVYGHLPTGLQMASAVGYGLALILAFLGLSVIALRRKEL